MDQHGTEDQTHGRAGGVRDAQTGAGDRPMIHHRRTVQIAPGRQADAVARAHEWVKIVKDSCGVTLGISVVTTGTLGRMCFSTAYESMGAQEALWAKWLAHPATQALGAKQDQEERDGTFPFVPNSFHDEFWRDA